MNSEIMCLLPVFIKSINQIPPIRSVNTKNVISCCTDGNCRNRIEMKKMKAVPPTKTKATGPFVIMAKPINTPAIRYDPIPYSFLWPLYK